MKKSTFKRKSALKSNSGFKAKSKLKPAKSLKSKKSINKRGKKTIEWERIRSILKVEFEKNNITSCELRLENCAVNNFLGFLHLAKRRNLSEFELYVTVLGCNFCHEKVEYLPAKEMRSILQNIIDNRSVKIDYEALYLQK